MNERRESFNTDGFSLIELVFAAALILVLSVGGVVAYNGFLINQREDAIELAARSASNDAFSNILDYDDRTTIEGALVEWNMSVGAGEFTAYTSIDVDTNCVEIGVSDNKGKVDDVFVSRDEFCNLDDTEIG